VCETVCEETKVTVSEAGEVTVENVKSEAPVETTEAPAETTEAPTVEESQSVAAPAVTKEPEVTSYEGSAAAVGGAGLAAIAFAAAGLVF